MVAQIRHIYEVDNDDAMPAVHRALARNKESHQEAVIIDSAILRARLKSGLPVADGNAVFWTRNKEILDGTST